MILNSILESIGKTPLVRLGHIAREFAPVVAAKCEFLNPTGSVKDRIGVVMIEDAERKGLLKPGSTIIEATSGNTGLGLALAANLRGYRAIFVMPDKMSVEKIRCLRAFGAEIVTTPTQVSPDDERSLYSVARQLSISIPGAYFVNQYSNPANVEAHFLTTGPEIWADTDGRITHLVCGIGSGGTITGVGAYLKGKNPDIQVIGVDTVGSILYDLFYHNPEVKSFPYLVEGIGEDMCPEILDFQWVDKIIKVTDSDSFCMVRRLAREEGLFCGGSSGAAVAAALLVASESDENDLITVVLPDSGFRYLSKCHNDEWIEKNVGKELSALSQRMPMASVDNVAESLVS